MEECAQSSGDAKFSENTVTREAIVEQEKFFTDSRSGRSTCKYPDPNVPEFYPRNFAATTTTMTATTVMSSSQPQQQQFQEDCDGIDDYGVGPQHYWTYYDPWRECYMAEVEDLRNQLNQKEMQLAHLNNVVKALLEEIWNMNESRTTRNNRERWNDDISFAVNEFLKPTIELGFHCDNCCNRFNNYIIKVLKQQERKCSRMLLQYKANFMESISFIVEKSIRVLTGLNVNAVPVFTRANLGEVDSRDLTRTQQPTKMCTSQTYHHPRGLLSVNPIQYVHQKNKNLSCRLQGIPGRNLVKFSYILNGKEYSATGSTKKEAQYHCASHILEATKDDNF